MEDCTAENKSKIHPTPLAKYSLEKKSRATVRKENTEAKLRAFEETAGNISKGSAEALEIVLADKSEPRMPQNFYLPFALRTTEIS